MMEHCSHKQAEESQKYRRAITISEEESDRIKEEIRKIFRNQAGVSAVQQINLISACLHVNEDFEVSVNPSMTEEEKIKRIKFQVRAKKMEVRALLLTLPIELLSK